MKTLRFLNRHRRRTPSAYFATFRLAVLIATLVVIGASNDGKGADTLWYLPPKADSVGQSGWLPQPFRRLTGKIKSFDSRQVTLIVDESESSERNSSEPKAEQAIAYERIVWIEPDWSVESDEVVAAIAAFEQRRFVDCLQPLTEFVKESDVQWRRLIAYGYLMQAAVELERFGPALAIASGFYQSHPPTYLYHLLPIDWTSIPQNAARQQAALAQLGSSNRGVAIVAASWLLSGPYREQAIAVLQQLSNDPADPILARLADSLRWRLAAGSEIKDSLDRWEQKVDQLPIALQPGPMATIADRLQANGLSGEAMVWWLSVATVGKRTGRLAAQAEAALQRLVDQSEQ